MCSGNNGTEWGSFAPQNNRDNRLNGCLEDDNKTPVSVLTSSQIKIT